MATLTIVIKDGGKATVTADGSKLSCDTAHEVEKAIGTVTKSVPTGQRVTTNTVTNKS
jgi:hypothetical protein